MGRYVVVVVVVIVGAGVTKDDSALALFFLRLNGLRQLGIVPRQLLKCIKWIFQVAKYQDTEEAATGQESGWNTNKEAGEEEAREPH